MSSELLQEWVPMNQAAKLLGSSDTTIERLTAAGKLESKLVPVPRRRPQRVFLVAGIERLKAARQQPKAKTEERSKIAAADRQFVFHLAEGPIVVGLPKSLSEDSLTDAVDFLQLLMRQLTRTVKPSGS